MELNIVLGTEPLPNRHPVITHCFNTQGGQIFQELAEPGNCLVPVRQTKLGAVNKPNTFQNGKLHSKGIHILFALEQRCVRPLRCIGIESAGNCFCVCHGMADSQLTGIVLQVIVLREEKRVSDVHENASNLIKLLMYGK